MKCTDKDFVVTRVAEPTGNEYGHCSTCGSLVKRYKSDGLCRHYDREANKERARHRAGRLIGSIIG